LTRIREMNSLSQSTDFQVSNMSSGLMYITGYDYSAGTAILSSTQIGTTGIYTYFVSLTENSP